ncbi:MAG: hypothetical protein IE927_13425 [Rhodobacterales bacterium]|nr:hypothetical protein [Rhodobacterales bacterium]
MTAAGPDLLAGLDLGPVARVALLGEGGLAEVLAAAQRWDCAVDLIDLDRKGAFAAVESPRAAAQRAALLAAGIDPARIARIARMQDLRPADLIVNLQGFGDGARIAPLAPVLAALIHADSRVLAGIRKGSGAFPFYKEFGRVTVLARGTRDGHEVTRIRLDPHPPAAAPAPGETPDDWGDIARSLAGPEGFFTQGAGHSFLFVPRDRRVLVVTFDNLDIAMGKRADRRPWGFDFIAKQGWSMLGVMAGGWTWYRDPWVWAEFDRLRDTGFFARFDRVVFYGASMGGYAAAAFSAACPGADVVAISPQSTLDKALVPWETRYSTAWGRDFSGPYGDAARASGAARQVTILYDPYEPLDRRHVDRFTGANVVRLRAPLMGHRLGSSLSQMGILTPIILGALDGSLTPAAFYRALRARRSFPRYQRELFQRAVARGHTGLARRLGRWVLTRGDNRAIRLALQKLDAPGGPARAQGA